MQPTLRIAADLAFGVLGIALAILWLAGAVPLGWWSCVVFALGGVRSLAKGIVDWDDRRSDGGMAPREP